MIVKKILLSFFALATASLMAFWFTTTLPFTNPVGCDPFGYVRQASLFQTKGLARGLDSAITNKEAQLLIETALNISSDVNTWSEMIAPHCHHYDAVTNKVILQYPPGTGFVLSLMPEGKSLQTISILMVLSISLLYAIANFVAMTFRYYLIATLFFYVQITIVTKFQTASYSVPVTLILLSYISLSMICLRFEFNKKNGLIAVILGFLVALLISVRLASFVLLPVFVLLAIISNWDLKFDRLNKRNLAVPILGLLAFIFFLIPLLYANKLNAGNYLSSTYGASDTQLVWNQTLFFKNINYYLFENPASLLVLLDLGLVGFVAIGLKSSKDCIVRNLYQKKYLILFYALILSVLFFCIKQIAIDYYLLPTAFFVFCYGMLMLAEVESRISGSSARFVKNNKLEVTLFMTLCVVLAIGFFQKRIKNIPIVNTVARAPEVILESDAIVYADDSGGALLMSHGKYSSKIIFGGFCVQEQLINQIYHKGNEQYFIQDSQAMKSLINGLGVQNFEKTGEFKGPYFNYDVFKLINLDPRPIAKCSSNKATLGEFKIDADIAQNISLSVNGSVRDNKFIGRVLIVNGSLQPFETFSTAGPVRLSWRFIRSDQNNQDPTWDERANINMKLLPGESEVVPVIFDLPLGKGIYTMEVSLLQDGVSWFHDMGMVKSVTVVDLN